MAANGNPALGRGASELDVHATKLNVSEDNQQITQTQGGKNLAAEINSAHAEAERSLRASVEHAIRAGELLLQAKRKIGHGNWTGWLDENITFSDRLAQAYIRLARLPVEKRNAVADLPLRDALSAIRSRQKLLADAAERESKPVTLYSGPLPPAPAPRPPIPPITSEEVAEGLITQLAHVVHEGGEQVNVDELRCAFERRFGTATSGSGVSKVSASPEKPLSGLPTGSGSARIPVPQTKSVKAQDISNVAYRLIQFDIHLAQELYGFLFDDDHIQQLRGDLITGIELGSEETGSDDGLDIPESLRRVAP
jgi:hypothetical protein